MPVLVVRVLNTSVLDIVPTSLDLPVAAATITVLPVAVFSGDVSPTAVLAVGVQNVDVAHGEVVQCSATVVPAVLIDVTHGKIVIQGRSDLQTILQCRLCNNRHFSMK